MKQSPSWEANSSSASTRNSPAFYGTRMFNYRIHKSPQAVSILSQINPVHAPTSHFLKIHLNIIRLPTPGSSKWSLSFRFPHQNPVYACPLLHSCYVPIQIKYILITCWLNAILIHFETLYYIKFLWIILQLSSEILTCRNSSYSKF